MISFLLVLVALTGSSSAWTGAVYEHARQDKSPNGPESNLRFYERATRLAKEQGADLILFPEYGIVPYDSREKMKQNLEEIPDPKTDRVVPCNERKESILRALSCMAKENAIVVVANMGGIEHCRGESGCPDDGDRHLNANVAFDRNGTLVGRYYKEHLYFEDGVDLPSQKQDPVFVTDVGKFAMLICFEIIFEKMVDVAQLGDVDAVLFSTLWLNSSPFYTSTQWFQAWSVGNNATLLAANLQMPGFSASGSGIFDGRRGAVASILSPDGISKLIVSTIPGNHRLLFPETSSIFALTENDASLLTGDPANLPHTCSYDILGNVTDVNKEYRCLVEDVANYTLIKLEKESDHLTVCHHGMCCELDYSATTLNETFYLGVYNGTMTPYSFNRYFWAEENCFLARCDDFNGKVCGNFPTKSKTVFHKVIMRANFTSKYVYPSFVASDMKLVPLSRWTYGSKQNKPTIEFNGDSYGVSLLMATLKGRVFSRDPPYIR